MWRPGTVIGEALREVSLRVPWLRRGVSFRTPGEWIGHFKASKRARILVRSSELVGHSWVFPGEGCGVSFWVWGTPLEWAFIISLTIHGDRRVWGLV